METRYALDYRCLIIRWLEPRKWLVMFTSGCCQWLQSHQCMPSFAEALMHAATLTGRSLIARLWACEARGGRPVCAVNVLGSWATD